MKAFPIGVEFFDSMIDGEPLKEPFYYADKTPLLRELAATDGTVHLITIPRRFGKSLNLDMIRTFFRVEPKPDRDLFQGLQIAEDRAFCAQFQGQYPVMSINLMNITGPTFKDACTALSSELVKVVSRSCSFLKTSLHLSEEERDLCRRYGNEMGWINEKGYQTECLPLPELKQSFGSVSHFLAKHYGRKVIVLVDEYDIPMYYAWTQEKKDPGYLDQMAELLRDVFTELFQDNEDIAFAVLTGYMKIEYARILSGVDKLTVWGLDKWFQQEYFGFTDAEVKAMLDHYGAPELYDTVKTWYGGCGFGGEPVYSPWDVLQYVNSYVSPRSNKRPRVFWFHSSRRQVLEDLLHRSAPDVQRDYLRLVHGETIETRFTRKLTFRDLEQTESLWSLMVEAGHLTVVLEREDGTAVLRAPNLELRTLMGDHIKWWVRGIEQVYAADVDAFCDGFSQEKVEKVSSALSWILADARRSGAPLHPDIVMGILYHSWDAEMEIGDTYCDVWFETEDQ